MKTLQGLGIGALALIAAGWVCVGVGCSGDDNNNKDGGPSDSGRDVSNPDSGGKGDSGGGDGGVAQTCSAFCTLVQSACMNENAVYAGMDTCMKICAAWPAGMSTDMAGDTLGCRIYHAGVASGSAMAAKVHCPHAGPGGGGMCTGADLCTTFCETNKAVCGTQAYADTTACMTACATFRKTDSVVTDSAPVSGNTVECRLYHTTAAAGGDAANALHCPHTAANSGPCSDMDGGGGGDGGDGG
jgi:hypothetical protein